VIPYGREGLATRQTLVILHVRAQGLEEGDEHFVSEMTYNSTYSPPLFWK